MRIHLLGPAPWVLSSHNRSPSVRSIRRRSPSPVTVAFALADYRPAQRASIDPPPGVIFGWGRG